MLKMLSVLVHLVLLLEAHLFEFENEALEEFNFLTDRLFRQNTSAVTLFEIVGFL